RRLAATARTREQVRMVDPVRSPVRATRFQGRGQGVGHVPLPHDLGKRRWTILPVQSHAPSLPAAPDLGWAAFESGSYLTTDRRPRSRRSASAAASICISDSTPWASACAYSSSVTGT